MKSIQEILLLIIARIDVKHKWQHNFILELLDLVYSVKGRLTFENMARYSKYNESTFRRNFSKFFDWLGFNMALLDVGGLFQGTVIAAMDCSFLPKAGKHTFGIDKFFSNSASAHRFGLEISLLALIEVQSATAWSVDVSQTPAGLSTPQGQKANYSRIDFYMEQLHDLMPRLKSVQYFVGDGHYAKQKVFNTLYGYEKHLITKLRPDANLQYLYQAPEGHKAKGRRRLYDGKVLWKQLDLSRWEHIGQDHKWDYLQIYTQVLNSPRLKRHIRVVLLHNTKTGQYILLACSDIDLDARVIVKYYQLRFKIEFLFRDAKQFTGLTHCQARDQDKLDFHFNMSLAALNLAQLHLRLNETHKSMNSFVRKAYNTRLIKFLFSQLSLKPELDLNHPAVKRALLFGCLTRAA